MTNPDIQNRKRSITITIHIVFISQTRDKLVDFVVMWLQLYKVNEH